MSDLESIEHSSSSCSIEAKLPTTNNLITGRESQYAVGKKIAQGKFGAVYEVLRKSDGKPFACKLEICGSHSHGLDMDYVIMNKAAKKACDHLISLVDRGKIEDHFKFIIMPMLGLNINKLRHMFVDGRFSLSTGLRLGQLALAPVQELHSLGFVHRDIKPSNLCVMPGTSGGNLQLVLIDYGVCRHFKDRNGEMKPPRENPQFRGTSRYASVSALNGEEQAPKDDLESWFYTMIEWMSGYLPWSELHRDDLQEIKAMKLAARTAEGTSHLFKYCPKVEFRRILKYLEGLHYHSHPDYTFLSDMMQLAIKNNQIRFDQRWDWEENE